MKKNVLWSEHAKIDYWKNIEYLIENWSESTAKKFINEVDFVLDIISIYPEMFQLTNYSRVRCALIFKQISLFYRVNDDKIELIRFWNNHMDKEKLVL